jgi:hypothetical protein
MSLLIYADKSELGKFFDRKIDIPNCPRFTKAYIVDLFIRYIEAEDDLSNRSLTLLYKEALDSGSFDKLQNIGDWLMFTKSLYPDSLTGASIEYYDTLARSAYYKCYLLLKREWLVYEELADQFPYFTETINQSFHTPNKWPGLLSSY